jgi:hypothetical protein
MKLLLLLLASLLGAASAFAPQFQLERFTTALSMGWLENLFEKPMHGHGSGENDLDEQWEAQQAILRDRRSHGIDKAHLKEKYSHEENRQTFDVGGRSSEYSGDETYVEESVTKKAPSGERMKFPWEK